MAAQLKTLVQAAYEHVCPVPPVTGAVSAVRRRTEVVLDGWKVCPLLADDALLVVSELVTNAILHARPPAVLRLSWVRGEHGGTLRVEVVDAGPALSAPLVGADPDEHGRGETIVHALATRHGMRTHLEGVTRWAELDVRRTY
jgi:anti-sigma regulatory factor (Ser/Thr protein kinase)